MNKSSNIQICRKIFTFSQNVQFTLSPRTIPVSNNHLSRLGVTVLYKLKSDKKLRYHRETARRAMSVKLLSTAA